MKFFSFFLMTLLILGCVHTDMPFDSIKVSFTEKKQELSAPALTSAPPLPSDVVTAPKPAVPEDKHDQPEEKKETIVAAPSVEKQEEKIQELAELPEKIQGKVILKKGNYEIHKKIKIPKGSGLTISPGTTITFQEAGIICEGTIEIKGTESEKIVLQGPDGWDNISILGEDAVGIFHHCDIQDGLGMEIDMQDKKECVFKKGGVLQGGAILFGNKSQGEILYCTIQKNFSQSAIALVYAGNIKIKNCKIAQNEENGMLNIESSCEIAENAFLENPRLGILFQGKSQSILKNNIFSKSRAGILVQSQAEPSFIGNRFAGNTVGIEYQMGTGGLIKENILEYNQLCGIMCGETSKPAIEKNKIQHNSIGVFIRNSASPSIKENVFFNNTEIALLMIETSSPVVSENQISNSKVAMVLQESTKADLKQNQIQNCVHEKQIAPPNAFDKKN
ncbi:MAG: right-handed parallel beta-helix repeat-containing protein [Candidatus Brocadiae bacterium]|nr:right-handed parallel beta-helix repeat-containing protein [Candidatus Brocadiia bacterium]